MLTPDYLLHVSEGAEAIAARLHTDLTKRITARILARQKRHEGYILTSADKWRLETLMDAGYLRDDLMQDIATATGKQLQEIKDAFEEAGVKSAAYDDKIYKAAGIEPTPFKQSPYMQRVMQRNYDATAGLWQNYTATTADAAQQTFINAMDDIYMKVASGGMSYSEAYAEAIDDLASNGIDLHAADGNTYVYYRNADGSIRHRDTIEVATLRCVRTGVSQMTAQVTEARMDENGVDLVLVSSHLGARPDHQVWQGKIYSRSGTDKKYPNFRESTGYGTGAGLCGWNCRHQFSPFFEGMDNPFTKYDSEENAEAYEIEQQQRAMERGIRKSRRKAEVLRESAETCQDSVTKEKLKELSDKAQKRLKRQIDAYGAYCDEHNLRPLPERLRIARASRATGRTNLEQIEIDPTRRIKEEMRLRREQIAKQQAEEERLRQEEEQRRLQRFELYASKIHASLDDQGRTDMENLIKGNPDEAVRKMWMQRSDTAVASVTRLNGGGVFRPTNHSMEWDYETHNGMSRYSTIAHEMNHAFDHEAGAIQGLTYAEVDAVNAVHNWGHVTAYKASSSDQFLSAVRRDMENMRSVLFDGSGFVSNDWIGILTDRLKNNASSGIQDAVDGYFGKDALTNWGHGESYYNDFFTAIKKHDKWYGTRRDRELQDAYKKLGLPSRTLQETKKTARIYRTASEAWANVGSAVLCGGDELAMIEKYMPETLAEYKRIVGMIV